jgi:hypothetical protein
VFSSRVMLTLLRGNDYCIPLDLASQIPPSVVNNSIDAGYLTIDDEIEDSNAVLRRLKDYLGSANHQGFVTIGCSGLMRSATANMNLQNVGACTRSSSLPWRSVVGLSRSAGAKSVPSNCGVY